MVGIAAGDPAASEKIGLIGARVHAVGVVEYLTDLDAATQQLFARRFDVVDDQIQALRGTWRHPSHIPAEDDGTAGTRRCKLNHAKIVPVVIVGVEPPSELRVESLRAVDVRDGDDDNFKLHVEFYRAGLASNVVRWGLIGHICHVLSSFAFKWIAWT